MKHFLRIAITIVVLVALGFGVWAIWFKPDPDQSTFLKLGEMTDYVEQIGLSENMQKIANANGHGKFTTTDITRTFTYKKDGNGTRVNEQKSETVTEVLEHVNIIAFNGIKNGTYMSFKSGFNPSYDDIEEARKVMFSSNKVNVLGDHSVYSYVVMEEYLNEAYLEYYAYVQMAKDVTNKAQKNINKSIEAYKDAVSSLNSSINSLYNYHLAFNLKYNEIEKTISTGAEQALDNGVFKQEIKIRKMPEFYEFDQPAYLELCSRYDEMVLRYRNMLSKYCDLIANLKNFITEFVFGGEIINEVSTVKYDLMLKTIKNGVSTNYYNDSEKTQSHALLSEAVTFIDKTKVLELESNGVSSYDMINSYNRLVSSYEEGLNKMLLLSAENKIKLHEGEAVVGYVTEYLVDIRNILTYYGYEKVSGGAQ